MFISVVLFPVYDSYIHSYLVALELLVKKFVQRTTATIFLLGAVMCKVKLEAHWTCQFNVLGLWRRNDGAPEIFSK